MLFSSYKSSVFSIKHSYSILNYINLYIPVFYMYAFKKGKKEKISNFEYKQKYIIFCFKYHETIIKLIPTYIRYFGNF